MALWLGWAGKLQPPAQAERRGRLLWVIHLFQCFCIVALVVDIAAQALPCQVGNAEIVKIVVAGRSSPLRWVRRHRLPPGSHGSCIRAGYDRSEEPTSELQSLMRISYAVFCLEKQNVRHQL